MSSSDVPAGLPGFRRASCLGCGQRVTANREGHVALGGVRDGSWLLLLDAEPDRVLATDPERFPDVSELLGVAHRGCVDLARGRLARGEIEFPKDLPTLVADEPDEPAEPLHRPPEPGSCPFCGGLSLTEEDVFPRWFGRLFPGYSFIDKNSSKPRSQAGITVPVCGGCNNTWLSVLENDTKPVLSPLIRGESFVDLNESQQGVLATWAMKTALMLDLANPEGPLIPLGFYRHFRQLRGRFLARSLFSVPIAAAWLSRFGRRDCMFRTHQGGRRRNRVALSQRSLSDERCFRSWATSPEVGLRSRRAACCRWPFM